jgi:hypothetical protein
MSYHPPPSLPHITGHCPLRFTGDSPPGCHRADGKLIVGIIQFFRVQGHITLVFQLKSKDHSRFTALKDPRTTEPVPAGNRLSNKTTEPELQLRIPIKLKRKLLEPAHYIALSSSFSAPHEDRGWALFINIGTSSGA